MRILPTLVIVYLLRTGNGQDCGTQYDILPDLERRDQSYVLAENEPQVFDGILYHKWYNVKERNMPTNATGLKIGSCGTYYPVWMRGRYLVQVSDNVVYFFYWNKGTVPSVADGVVARTTCIMSFYSYCSVEKTIEVRNCSTNMIYKLGSTTKTSGYCFNMPRGGQVLPPIGPESAEVKSYLTFVEEISSIGNGVFQNPKLFFSCAFNESENETFFYKVVWFVNDILILSRDPVLYMEIENTSLSEDELRNRSLKLDITIKCGVQASNRYNSTFGEMTTSPGFWAGIKVLTPDITIKQGEIGAIHLQSTVPFGCIKYGRAPECFLPIEMYDPYDSYDCERSSISVQNSESCGTNVQGLTFENWIDHTVFNGLVNITLTTKDIDDFNQDRNSFVLTLRTPQLSTANEIMNDNFIGDITVHVEAETAWVRKNCYSRIDPHMMTFDQKYYENQNLGEFVLYRHTSFKQEVQMKTYDCYGATCACAVSVRAGGELFIIDVCFNPGLIKHASCKEKLMNIQKRNEYKYEIYMPLGTMVVVDIENWPNPFSSLNIEIIPSVRDVGRTEGLCGKLNDEVADDFTTPSGMVEPDDRNNEFSISWRLDSSQSFLNPNNHDPAYWEEYLYLCVCPSALNTTTKPSVVIGSDRDPLCSPSVYLACTKKKEFPGKQYDDCNVISKRSGVSHINEIRRILAKRASHEETYKEEHTFYKRSADYNTMEGAKTTCEELFNNSCLASDFEDLANTSVSRDSAIHDCTLDLFLVGDIQLVDIHCSSYTAETERYIRKDSEFRKSHSEEVLSFYAKACIHNCNGHGDCINGMCVCNEPYIEEDCSISKADPPAILDIYNGGICSRNNDECCGSIPIYGNRFVSGVTKLKLEQIEVNATGSIEIKETTVRDLQVLNAFEAEIDITCETRKRRSTSYVLVSGVQVSLSNNGTNYGASQIFFTYDSNCQGYENSTNGPLFYILDGKCYINGVCYSKDETDPFDDCNKCRPKVDPLSFTCVPDFKPESIEVRSHLTFVQETNIIANQPFQNPKVFFSCDFSKSDNESLFYTVSWNVNGFLLTSKEAVPYTEINKTILREDELTDRQYKLNINIECGVQASRDKNGTRGEMTTSPQFWAGIKILTPVIWINQGQTGVIQLHSTVPFGCIKFVNDPSCSLPIEMYDPYDSYDCQASSISVQGSEKCYTEIQGLTFEAWMDQTVFNGAANITITTKDKDDFNQDRNSFVLTLRTPPGSTANKIMNDNYLGDIKVYVRAETAWVQKNCYSRIDPHMKSFDEKYYENQNVGEYVLYRHTVFRQEVQMKTFECYWAKCACAVSVRAGGELFIIDVCRSPSLIRHASCSENIMIIRKMHEYKYEIYMPLGTMVVVDIIQWPNPEYSLNIEITPSVKDVEQTEGLCGKLNNNPEDDFTTPSGTVEPDYNNDIFSNSWRFDYSKSYLNPNNHNPDKWEEYFHLCVCPSALNTTTKPSVVSGGVRDSLCSPSVYLACTKKKSFPGNQYDDCSVIFKRSTVSHTKEIRRILMKRTSAGESANDGHILNKRSAINYTMDEAKAICEKIFNESCVADTFKDLSNNTISREGAIHDCTLDLVIVGDLKLVDVHCSSFTAETERYIRKDSVIRSTLSSEVQSFYAKTCINNCNGHGDCVNGTCICNELYVEADCSISKADPPVVLDTYNGGVCSKSDDECCGPISIYGIRFVSGVTKQKVEKFEVLANGTVEFQEAIVRDLQILNAFEAEMDVPCRSRKQRATSLEDISLSPVYGVRVSLSNDGINYGAAQSFYIYDASCQRFEKNTSGYSFYMLNGTCYINGLCYTKDEKNPSDVCKQCRPEKDPYSFTGECASDERNPPKMTTETVIIVAAVSGGMVIIFIAGTILIIKLCQRGKKGGKSRRRPDQYQIPGISSNVEK